MENGKGSFSWGIFFDEVHILSVNQAKQEVRLFENSGAGTGRLLIRNDEPADKVSIADAMRLLNMGLRFGVSFELLSQCATEDARQTLELLGAKEFLGKMLTLTTEEERRMRFQGFHFSFTNGVKETTKPPPAKRTIREKGAGGVNTSVVG